MRIRKALLHSDTKPRVGERYRKIKASRHGKLENRGKHALVEVTRVEDRMLRVKVIGCPKILNTLMSVQEFLRDFERV